MGRKSNEQEPTFLQGLGHHAAQTAGRGSSYFRQTPLYCSPLGEKKECNAPKPSGSVGTCPAQRTSLTSPPHWFHLPLWRRFLPSSPWGRTSDPSSLSQAGGTGMDISLLDTQGNPQKYPSSCEPCHVLLWPAENVSKPLYVQGPSLHPITPRTSQHLPTPFTHILQ